MEFIVSRRSHTPKLNNEGGFTLLESVIAMVMVAIIVISAVSLFSTNIISLQLGNSRSAGLALANEKMEYLRDLPYDSLATQNGDIYPGGSIADNQEITRNNIKFRVNTRIKFVDDPFDGNAEGTIPSKPTDFYNYDYKQAEIKVYTVNDNRLAAMLSTNISGKAAETATNTGILRIKVLDANGLPVEAATVNVTNASLTPALNLNSTTDANGLLVLPKLPPDSSHRYKITVSKSGYSTDETMADPSGSQTPVLINPNVLVQQISDVTLSIDRTSNLNVNAVDTSGNPISNVPITITSSKLTFTNPNVAKTTRTINSDSNGQSTFGTIPWDSYSITVGGGYLIASSNPFQPYSVDPNTSPSLKLVLTNNASFPRITSVSPDTETTGNGNATLTINGANLSGAAVKLQRNGESDINGTGVSGSGSSITANLNLSNAAPGSWNIVVTTGSGTIVQEGGLYVSP